MLYWIDKLEERKQVKNQPQSQDNRDYKDKTTVCNFWIHQKRIAQEGRQAQGRVSASHCLQTDEPYDSSFEAFAMERKAVAGIEAQLDSEPEHAREW